MGTIPVASAQIVGLFMESVFYGLYLVSCWFCGEKLFIKDKSWKGSRNMNWVITVVALFLFVNGTTNLALGLYRIIIAFVYYDGPRGPTGYLTNISDWINVAKTATLNAQTIVGDSILIYRCYIVYGKSWKIVLPPIILWIGCFYVVVRQTIIDVQLRTHALVSGKELRPYLIAFWALTIAQNIMTTGLIVIRIWDVDRQLEGASKQSISRLSPGQSQLRRVMIVIVESGLLITTIAFITFVNVICKSNGLYTTANMGVVAVGIAYNLIIIRTGTRESDYYTQRTETSVSLHILPPTATQMDFDTDTATRHIPVNFRTQDDVSDSQYGYKP